MSGPVPKLQQLNKGVGKGELFCPLEFPVGGGVGVEEGEKLPLKFLPCSDTLTLMRKHIKTLLIFHLFEMGVCSSLPLETLMGHHLTPTPTHMHTHTPAHTCTHSRDTGKTLVLITS